MHKVSEFAPLRSACPSVHLRVLTLLCPCPPFLLFSHTTRACWAAGWLQTTSFNEVETIPLRFPAPERGVPTTVSHRLSHLHRACRRPLPSLLFALSPHDALLACCLVGRVAVRDPRQVRLVRRLRPAAHIQAQGRKATRRGQGQSVCHSVSPPPATACRGRSHLTIDACRSASCWRKTTTMRTVAALSWVFFFTVECGCRC